jgi:hypothetical protein
MSDRATHLATFMAEYERAANSHDIQQVVPWRGVQGPGARVVRVVRADRRAGRISVPLLLTGGVVGGQPNSGRGRGANILVKLDGAWQVEHECLSY